MTQRAIYRKVTGNQFEESTTPFFQGDTPFRYDDPEAEEATRQADKLLKDKQALLDTIKPKQQKAMGEHADVWSIKTWQAELQNKANKATVKAQGKQVADWCDAVRALNNNITTSNTLAEIQARLDSIDAYVAIFPYLTQAEYDADALGVRG